MFKNEYQGGPYLEIFSPQGRGDLTSHWKIAQGAKKAYDKEVKGYVYILEGTPSTTKIHAPKDSKQSMTLIQRYLVLQIYLNKGQDFSLELGICDLSNNKRRIQLSTAQKETQITPLHARIPLCVVHRAVWLNLCLDIVSLVGESWSGQTFHTIDQITVSANCKLRRIFSMKYQPPDTTDDNEQYGCHLDNAGEVEMIPRQMQLAPDITQLTQVLTMSKIRSAERVKNGKCVTLAELIRPGSMLDSDLNTSCSKGNFHIAFGSKVMVTATETSGKSSKQGSNTNRSLRSILSRADGSCGGGSLNDLRDSTVSCDSKVMGVNDSNQRSARPAPSSNVCTVGQSQSSSGHITLDEQDSIAINGVGPSHIVTPHPPREPSSDRVRRYHRVRTVSNSAALNQYKSNNAPDGMNTSKEHVSSVGSVTGGDAFTDSGIASSAAASLSSAARSDFSADNISLEMNNRFGDASKQAIVPSTGPLSTTEDSQQFDRGAGVRDSVSDVIALLRPEGPGLTENDGHSSDSGTESSHPGEYEESDDEGSSDTANKLHLFVSRPVLVPRRNISPSTADQEPNKRSHIKTSRSNIRRSTLEILSSRGALPEDDFHSNMTSSDEEENYRKPRANSRPHSGTSTTSSPKSCNNNPLERTGMIKGRAAGMPKVTVSPDGKRPAFNPALYGDTSTTHTKETVRHSRKSLREIKPYLEEGAFHTRSSEKSYDHTKYEMADVTASFEARMLASMKRQEEEELENLSTPLTGATGTQPIVPHPAQAGSSLQASQQVCSESPYTTSDDDTSFSTWKAPAPNQMAHNYQDEMKSRLSSDTLTSSNPRDWSSVFSPPIILPSNKDMHGTLEGHFEDLNDAGMDAHTTGPSTSEDEELDLLFDPNLNCYYDPKTLKYYELAT